jgi:hypothetical protein
VCDATPRCAAAFDLDFKLSFIVMAVVAIAVSNAVVIVIAVAERCCTCT